MEISFDLWLEEDEIREWRRATAGGRRVFLVVDVALLIVLFVVVFSFASSKVQYYVIAYFVIRLVRLLFRLPDRSTRIRALLRTGDEIRLTTEAYVVIDSRGSAETYPWRQVTKVKETRRLWLFRFRGGHWRAVPKRRLTDGERRELAAFVQGPALPAARVNARR